MINIIKFEKDIKFKFKNKSLILSALTHKSANHKDDSNGKAINNLIIKR